MPIRDKLNNIIHRGNSEKGINANANTTTTTTVAAPRSYEIPAEPVVAAPLAGRSYELPVEEPIVATTNTGLAGRSYEIPAEPVIAEPIIAEPVYNNNIAGNRLSVGAVRAAPTVIETIEKDVVVHERIHPVEKEEIQPIIYREREQLDVKQVTQMMHETHIQPTLIEQRELAAEVRAPIVERGAPIQENIILPTVQRDATLRTQQIHEPIVEEVIKKTVIEEIQPVLERDVFVPTIVQNTQPIYEKIVEAPTVYREVRQVQELGTREVAAPFVAAPIVAAPIVVPEVVREVVTPGPLQVVPITTTTTVETYDHKLNPIETRDFINNRGLPLR